MPNETKQTIIDVATGAVVKKSSHDKITLVGSYFDKDSPYVENVEIVINPEQGGPAISTKVPYSGYNLELFIGDFNGDEKDEIMLRGDYGGSGSFAIATVYDFNAGKLVEIFNPDMFSEKYKITAKYLEGYKVLITSITLNEYYIFDISKKPKEYLNLIYDENGKVREFQEPTVSNLNSAFPIKVSNKNIYYLFIRQRIVGVANADTIGYVESFVSLLENNITVDQMGFYSFGETLTTDRSTTNGLEDKFPLGTIFIPVNKYGYTEDTIKFDLDFDGHAEMLIPYTLNGIPYLGLLKATDGDYSLKSSYKGEGYNIKDLIIKKIGKKIYIFLGFQIGGNMNKLHILTYKNNKLIRVLKLNHYYTKIYIKDLNEDGKDALILWTQDTGEGYKIDIYDLKESGLTLTNKFDKIYYPKVVKHYKRLLKKHENSSTYLYYLALAYYKMGEFDEALIVIDKALNTKHPYPSVEKLMDLKKKANKNLK